MGHGGSSSAATPQTECSHDIFTAAPAQCTRPAEAARRREPSDSPASNRNLTLSLNEQAREIKGSSDVDDIYCDRLQENESVSAIRGADDAVGRYADLFQL